MKHKRHGAGTPTASIAPPPPPKAPSTRNWPAVVGTWQAFWFSAVNPVGLHALRVLVGLLLVAWLLPFAGHVDEFFGQQGWFDQEGYLQTSRLAAESPMPLTWSLVYLAGANPGLVHALYWGTIGIFLLFALGLATRFTGVLTWLLVVSFQANPATRFDADYLLAILAFYLMIGYLLLGQWNANLAPWERILGGRGDWLIGSSNAGGEAPPSYAANLAVRLLQVHFAIIVVSSGLHKLQFGAWWSGSAFWFALHTPHNTTEPQLRALTTVRTGYLVFLSLLQYGTLAWQLCFPVFAWRQGWSRAILLGGAALGWLACWDLYQLPLFGPIYVIGCLSFLSPREWAWLKGILSRVVPGARAKLPAAAAKQSA